MTRCLRLDDQDKRALRKLDHDFVISTDGERAVISGEMEVRVARDDGNRLCLTITFPGGEELDVRIARAQLLEQLDVTFLRQQELEDVKLQLRQQLDDEANES